MKIATWNVNSIRMRLERVLPWLEQHRPDVLCMQETKVEDELFPVEELARLGYRVVAHGQKTYNGVALVARQDIAEVARGLGDGGDDAQARLIAGNVRGVRVVSVYVPNGGTVGSDKYAFKLDWLRRLRAYLETRCDPGQPLVVAGDFNVAPEDRDVHDPTAWAGEILCSEPEREGLRQVAAWGLTDAFRRLHPEPGFFTWWDYRMLGFAKGRGLRIDHMYVTAPLLERCTDVAIDREARKGKQPSDHAPVVLTLREPGE